MNFKKKISMSKNNVINDIISQIYVSDDEKHNHITVSELNNKIDSSLKINFDKNIYVKGEISNLKYWNNRTYLTLKDSNSSIDVVFFDKNIANTNGDNVIIFGNVMFYRNKGSVNLRGISIKHDGIGNLHAVFEHNKKKYQELGYFNNKKPLPNYVKNIGIITSSTGAVIEDFMKILMKHKFTGNVFLYDCIVQGDKCPEAVASGINFFEKSFDIIINDNVDSDTDNSTNIDVDVIVIARGGGSFEDLSGFSHPRVLEAIHKSSKYTISAIGHEPDNMLSDYVANCRAATPTEAGELICSITNNSDKLLIIEHNIEKLQTEIRRQLYEYKSIIFNLKELINDPNEQLTKKITTMTTDIEKMRICMLQTLFNYKNKLYVLKNNISDPYEKINKTITNIIDNSVEHIRNKLSSYKKNLDNLNIIIQKYDYHSMLNEGVFIIVDSDGHVIKNANHIFNKKVSLIHQSGSYEVTIKKLDKNKLINQ